MPYSDFTVKTVQNVFQVRIVEQEGMFFSIQERQISAHLAETLRENVALAVTVNTEKARSELIIAPILVELRKIFKRKISLFSGIELNADKDKNLTGFCDFVISLSPEQLFLKAPIITIVEAKNENIMSGLGQCMAEMIGAKIVNKTENNAESKIYGVITSGSLWKFMKIEEDAIYVDLDEYSIKEHDKIIGILSAMVEQTA